MYGNGTPYIALAYTGTWQTHNTQSWGTLPTGPAGGQIAANGVAQIEAAINKNSTVRFTSEKNNTGVSLGSFNFNGHEVGASYKFKVTVTGSLAPDTLLFDKEFSWTNNAGVIHNGGAVVDFGGVKGQMGEALTLTLTLLEGNNMNIAVDNIAFSQTGFADYHTVLTRLMDDGATATWSGSGWKNGTTDVVWEDSTSEKKHGASIAAGSDKGSTLTIAEQESRTTEYLELTTGNLTIAGGTLNMTGASTVKIDSDSTLTLDTTVNIINSPALNIEGKGTLLLKKDQTWNNIDGTGKLHLAADLTLTGDSIGTTGITLSGGGSLYKNGTGTTCLSDTAGLTGEAKIQANGGTLVLSSVNSLTGASGKRINVGEKGTVCLETATLDKLVATISGNGTLALSVTGGNTNNSGITLDLSQADFTGKIKLDVGGRVNVSTSDFSQSSGIILNGGGLLASGETILNEEVHFLKDSFLRAIDGKLIVKGKFFTQPESSGSLNIHGTGEVVLQGDFSEFKSSIKTIAGCNAVFDFKGNAESLTLNGKSNFTSNSDISLSGNLNIANTQDITMSGKLVSKTGMLSMQQNSKLTLNEGAHLTFARVRTSDTGSASPSGSTLNIEKGASLFITGNTNSSGSNSSSVLLGHWVGNTVVNLKGLFEARAGVAYFGIGAGSGGTTTLTLHAGGIANFYGVEFHEAKHIFNLEGGTLNLGERGISKKQDGTKVRIKSGTIGTSAALTTISTDLEFLETGILSFNTEKYDLDARAYTQAGSQITISSVISQKEAATGSLLKEGSGTLILSGANTFKGGITIKEGALSLLHANALGAANFRNLTIDGAAALMSTITGQTVDKLTMTAGSSLNIGGSLQKGDITIGAVNGASTFAMDLLADGTSDSLTLSTALTASDSIGLQLLLSKSSLGKTYTNVLNGIGSGNGGKVTLESGYRNSLILTGSENGGNYQVAVSGSFTSENLTWNNSVASGTWKLGATGAASWSGAGAGKESGFYNADNVTFNVPSAVDANKFQTVNLEGVLSPTSVTVTTAADKNYLFTNAEGKSGFLSGETTLIKEGEGTLLLQTSTPSNYTGETKINGGILEIALGSLAKTSKITIAENATLKVHELIGNNIIANGRYIFSFNDSITHDLGTLDNVTWGANSSLILEKGVAKGEAGLFKGKGISVQDGAAFDLSGKNRDSQKFDLELSGQGVQLSNGNWTGVLFSSGAFATDYYGFPGGSGIDNVRLRDDVMIQTSGGNASGTFSAGNGYEFTGKLDLNGKTLTKTGAGMLYVKNTSGTNNGHMIIKEGSVMQGGTDFGIAGEQQTSITIHSGAGFSSYNKTTVYADITLDSSSTDLALDYVTRNYASLFMCNDNRANSSHYAGDITLINGGVLQLGWGAKYKTSGNMTLTGSVSGSGTLYLDATGCDHKTDSDTDSGRIRHLYLGAKVTGIDKIQLLGNAVLQLSTVNSVSAVATDQNATIKEGLTIVGGGSSIKNIVKIATTGSAVTYTGLNFGVTKGLDTGMELRVQRENTSNTYLTTLTNTTGTLEVINIKEGALLTLDGSTNLKVNTGLNIAGEKAAFTLAGGTFNVTQNVTVATGSQMAHSGASTVTTVGGNLTLSGAGSELFTSGGRLSVAGRLIMQNGSNLTLNGNNTTIDTKQFFMNGQGSTMTIEGGTLKVGVGYQDGSTYVPGFQVGAGGEGNYAIVKQKGGVVDLVDAQMANWANTKESEYILSGGLMKVSSYFQVGNDGSGKLEISGGTANIEKLTLGKWSAKGGKTFTVQLKGGRLNLGQGGLVNNNTKDTIKLVEFSGGTLGSMADNWSTNVELTLSETSAGNFTVDTTKTDVNGNTLSTAAKITWGGIVKGDGGFTVTGKGTLELGGSNEYTGDTTVGGNATLVQNGTELKAKVILKENGTFRMGGDNKKAGEFELQGGQLILDKTGAAIGAVTIKDGALNLTQTGVQTGAINMSGGTLNASADSTLASLSMSGGTTHITAGALTIGTSPIMLSGNARLKFSGKGNLADGTEISTSGTGATIELAQLNENEETRQAYTFKLSGDGKLLLNNAEYHSTYAGKADTYKGQIHVQAGILTLDSKMIQATARIDQGARLNLSQDREQITSLTGTGKVSFTNTAVNLTSASLLSGYTGTLLIDAGQNVTFTYNGAGLLGAGTTVEYTGSTGTLVLNNSGSTYKETIKDIKLTTKGTLKLTGTGMDVYLGGQSWWGDLTVRSELTLDPNDNTIYVDKTLTETQLNRLYMISGGQRVPVILDEATGALRPDKSIELTVSHVDDIAQSYLLTADHSGTGGKHTLDGPTNIRSLSITASDTPDKKNTSLVLQDNIKLVLKTGKLSIDGDTGYTISGGTIGLLYAPTNPQNGSFTIQQSATGTVTINSRLDNTVHTLNKQEAGTLVMSGTLENTGGLYIQDGKLILTGTSAYHADAWITNKAQLTLGDSNKAYQVNYAGLNATAGSETTLSAKATLNNNGFAINNGGTLHLTTGAAITLDHAITGYNYYNEENETTTWQTGTTHLGGNTSLTQPGGGEQSYTIDQGSTLTWNMSQATATGKTITGDGQINLHNNTGAALDLSNVEIGTGWKNYKGQLNITGNHPVTLALEHLGDGASITLNAGSKLIDKAAGTETRHYNITLGDNATWQLTSANGAAYKGTLTLGTAGTLINTQTEADQTLTFNTDISGGTLHLTGGTYHLGGNNTHTQTHAGANTTLISGSQNAFGNGLLLDQEGTIARITGTVTTGTLTGNANGTLQLNQDSHLTATNGTDWSGTLTGNGTLTLGGNNTLNSQDDATNGYTGTLNTTDGSRLTLGTSLGTATIHIGQNATLDITGNTRLSDNALTLGAGSTLTGGENYNGKLSITGNQHRENATSNGNLHLATLHLTDTSAKLNVTGNLTIDNGGSFKLSDANSQDAYGALVTVDGSATLGGIYDLILDVNNTFTDGKETKNYILFKAQGGLNITTAGNATQLKLDASLEEFFTLNQNNFKNTGTVSITRKEMTCYLLDPTHVNPGGTYHNGYTNTNNTSYLGANANNDGNNHPSVFYFDRKYTIAQGDNAYRLTNGDAWMNFHVKMTDTQIGAPTKLVVRENWMAPNDQGGILLSIRGSADDTYTGGTQIYQAKVKIDGTLNDQGNSGSSTLENGDVYFLGTGRVELTGAKAALILNTGGDNSNGEYTWNNEIHLQQGAVIEQTSSNNILAGNIKITDNAILRNTGDQILTLSGKNITGNQLKIQGNGNTDTPQSAIELATVNGDKVNAKLTLADISRNAHLTIGREATAHITSLYLDKDSQVSVTLGGTLALKEVKNGINGAGNVNLAGGTLRLLGDYNITKNGAKYNLTEHSTIDTNRYYMEINQYLTGWSDFTVTGGGTVALLEDLGSYTGHATITGENTTVSINNGRNLSGTWTVKDGGTLQTKENVSISGTLNIEAGGKTDFGQGTWMDNAKINLRSGATYSGFLNGNGATITFENGSHFQVKTEDLRKLTEMSGTPNATLLSADTINIQNGNGFFRFTGGDGIVNDALLDASQTKTLIYGKEAITVGGLGGTTTATAAHDLTDQQLAAMIGDNTYRWLTFQLTADKTGDTGSKLNLTVTRHVNFGELAQTANQAAIAPTLSHIGMQGGKTDSTLIGEQLNQLGLALTKATDNAGQMLSNISLSTSSVLNGYTVQRENLRRHTYDLRDRAVQERPCALRHQYETLENTLWANGIGATYTVDGDNNAVGHTTSQWGGQLGISRCINDNLVMGIAFTYTDSELTLDQGMGKATSSAYYIDLYAKYHKDNWNLTGVLTGGITDLDTTRHMNIPGYSSTTTGSSTGNQIMGLVELGYEIDLYGDRSNILEPFATLNAGYSTIDSFREKGAGTAGLDIASQNMASAAIGAGLRYVKEYSAGNDNLQKGRFEIRAMILQDLTDTATDIEARFIGAPGQNFTQKSVEPGKTGLLLGTGIVIPATINLSLFADLDGEFRDSETGCRANIGLKYAF